jgi:hypothetical protein
MYISAVLGVQSIKITPFIALIWIYFYFKNVVLYSIASLDYRIEKLSFYIFSKYFYNMFVGEIHFRKMNESTENEDFTFMVNLALLSL